jgi:hypothetical protein
VLLFLLHLALEVFLRVMHGLDAHHFRYRTWQDFEAQYGDGDMALENYVRYYGYLYEAAKPAYDAEGVQALQHMWEAFVVANVQEIDDDKLAEVLRHVQPALAQMLAAWPK